MRARDAAVGIPGGFHVDSPGSAIGSLATWRRREDDGGASLRERLRAWRVLLSLVAFGSVVVGGCARDPSEVRGGGQDGGAASASQATAARLEPEVRSSGTRPAGEIAKPTAEPCAGCHEEQSRFWAYGAHAGVACHACHDVKGDHIEAGVAPRVPGNDRCLHCHPLDPERSKAGSSEAELLEIHLRKVETMHVVEVDRAKVKGRCIYCHEPHLGE